MDQRCVMLTLQRSHSLKITESDITTIKWWAILTLITLLDKWFWCRNYHMVRRRWYYNNYHMVRQPGML